MKARRTNTFVIVIIMLAAAVVLYALLAHSTAVDTASVILPTPASAEEAQNSDDDGNETLTIASVTPDTVQSAIGTLSRPESYSRSVTVEDFWDNGTQSSLTELSVWVSGGSTRISVDRNDDVQNILLSDGKLYIWYNKTNEVFSASASDGSSEADAWLRCLTYEELLALPTSAIIDAGYTEHAGEYCIFAEYISQNFNYNNKVYVSVNTGLLMGAETYDGEALIYRMTSGTPDISVPDSRMFSPPKQD